MPRYGLSLQDVYLATRQLRATEGRALSSLAGLSQTPGLSEGRRAGTDTLSGRPRRSGRVQFGVGVSGRQLSAGPLGPPTRYGETWVRSGCYARRCTLAVPEFRARARPAGSGLPIQRTLDRVRQLVLLAEERDLRQVPAAALHIDAVRLMTVHGSKGPRIRGCAHPWPDGHELSVSTAGSAARRRRA